MIYKYKLGRVTSHSPSRVALREFRMGKRESVGCLYGVQAILIVVVIVSIAGGGYVISQLYQDQVDLRADIEQQKSKVAINSQKIAQLQQKFLEIVQKVKKIGAGWCIFCS